MTMLVLSHEITNITHKIYFNVFYRYFISLGLCDKTEDDVDVHRGILSFPSILFTLRGRSLTQSPRLFVCFFVFYIRGVGTKTRTEGKDHTIMAFFPLVLDRTKTS